MSFEYKFHKSQEVLHYGCEKPRAYFVPYHSEASALTDNRAASARFFSLCGDWDFRYYPTVNELPDFIAKDFVIEGFDKINENFSKTFRDLFGGGSASLSLSDPENILESGIDINVKLPGKNVPSLEGLSGGEKALIALSIYFAIMRVNAPPFCFLDEVDTALDDINVDRFAYYMKSEDFNTQFICVTHRRGTMEQADMLYGVTMQEKGITKLLELNVAELEKKLLENQGA